MWGPPEFEAYTFLIHFAADDRSGDGMEHLTSTQIIEPGALADKAAPHRYRARPAGRMRRDEVLGHSAASRVAALRSTETSRLMPFSIIVTP